MSDDLKGTVQKNSSKDVIVLDGKDLSSVDDKYIDFWIRIESSLNKNVSIRKIKSYKAATKTVTLDTALPFTPEVEKDAFTISKLQDLKSNIDATVMSSSTVSNIILSSNAKKLDNVYKDYWVKINNSIRQVKDYKNNTLTLDYDLTNVPKEGDTVNIYAHFFNDYIIMGIDFTDVGGTDMSGLIDIFGGVFNFEIASIISIVSCCLLIVIAIIMFVIIKKKKGKAKADKGLVIPGIGKLGPEQPLIIEMPMQARPYPFPNSPFPRDT